jgi:hypothetical protein
MRMPRATEWANGFMWLAVLTASVILLWGTDYLWLMVIVVLGCASGSMMAVSAACRRSNPRA